MSGIKADSQVEKIVENDEDARYDAEADREIDAGQFVSHERLVEWLRSWGEPDEMPCPKPDAG